MSFPLHQSLLTPFPFSPTFFFVIPPDVSVLSAMLPGVGATGHLSEEAQAHV